MLKLPNECLKLSNKILMNAGMMIKLTAVSEPEFVALHDSHFSVLFGKGEISDPAFVETPVPPNNDVILTLRLL